MTNKKVIIYVILLLIVFLGGFFTHSLITPTQEETLPIPDPYKALPSSQKELPECFAGKCPHYFTWDVNGDNQMSDSVVVIPTAMTKGAAKVWVIDKGKVIFDSGELMDAWVEEPEDGKGFYLLYKTYVGQPNSERVKYIYKDNKFIPETR